MGSAEQLRPHGLQTAEVHCWTPLATRKGPRTLANRFKFRDSPPVVLLVSGGQKPRLLNSHDLTVDGLVRQALHYLRSPTASSEDHRAPKPSKPRAHGKRGAPRDYVGQRPREEDPIQTSLSAESVDEVEDGAEEAEEVVDLDA